MRLAHEPVVRTVLGDIAPADLGPTDYHEHLFQRSPLLLGEDLDDEASSSAEASLLRAAGARAMVEATPIGLGRRPAAVARISAARELHVVHATGAHHQGHYPGDHPFLTATVENLVARYRAEVLDGMDDTAVRAGVVKAGIGLWSIGPFEQRTVTAAAEVSRALGVPVMVHLEYCSAAHEVLDLLHQHGCPPDRVALAHVDRNPDPGLHLELASRGAYLGYDGAARHQRWPDSMLIETITRVIDGGGLPRLLLGGDVARRSRYTAYGGMPGLSYLFSRFVPRLRAEIGVDATDALLRHNPATWLSWRPPSDPPAESSGAADE